MQEAKEVVHPLLSLPGMLKGAVQLTGHVFTYRPLSTTDAKLHKQKCKPPKVKAVQPQEVNSSLDCYFVMPEFMIYPLLLLF